MTALLTVASLGASSTKYTVRDIDNLLHITAVELGLKLDFRFLKTLKPQKPNLGFLVFFIYIV